MAAIHIGKSFSFQLPLKYKTIFVLMNNETQQLSACIQLRLEALYIRISWNSQSRLNLNISGRGLDHDFVQRTCDKKLVSCSN